MVAASSSKSEFVRAQPLTVSPADVVAKAQSEGIKLDKRLVHQVRFQERKKASKGAEKLKKGMTATSFVRTLPSTIPPAEVISRGAQAGFHITTSLVGYARRPIDRETKKRNGRRSGSAPRGAKADLVRKYPHSLPVKEVIRLMQADGTSISPAYVRAVREKDVGAPSPKTSKNALKLHAPSAHRVQLRPSRPSHLPPLLNPTSPKRVESLLKSFAAEIGLGRAIEILVTQRASILALVGEDDNGGQP